MGQTDRAAPGQAAFRQAVLAQASSGQATGEASRYDNTWSRSYIRAFSCLLAFGGVIGLLNPVTLGGFSTPTRFWISIATGICFLGLLALLQFTRSLILVVTLASPVALLSFASGFAFTGQLYYVALGMTLPITVALFASTRAAVVVLTGYVVSLLLLATAIQTGYWIPNVEPDHYMAGLVPEAMILALITTAITASTIWKERMVTQIRIAEATASAQVTAQQRRFETICRSAYDAIFETDSDGVCTWAHGRLIDQLGFNADALLGQSLLPLLSHTAKKKFFAELNRSGVEETSFCFDATAFDASNRIHWVRLSGGNFIDNQGDRRWVCAAQDIDAEMTSMGRISERSRLESLGTVCGGLAHDFNNLLTVIGIYGELVENDEIRKGILQSQKQASDLTASLLTFARKQEFRQQTFQVCELLTSNRSMIERLVPENIQCSWSLNEEDAWVCVDPGQLQQVVINVVNNATQAMPDGGKLTIIVEPMHADPAEAAIRDVQPGPFVRISVTDTGSGMSSETAARSVEPFFTTKPRGQGTGLGLATAHGTARRAGGWIEVDSQIDVGTKVSILLPQQTSESDTHPIDVNEALLDAKNYQPGLKILLIEDRASLQNAISKTLTSAGHTVVNCTTGEEAWECFRTEGPFDLFVTDIVLPGISGTRWIREVRKLMDDAKVILISGHQQDDISIVNERPDITWFLPKPFRSSELLTTVNRIR